MGGGMEYEQRIFVRLRFNDLLFELFDNEFERFFHSLMTARYPDFFPVRTAGKLGDQGADGITLRPEKLYACYAPETFSEAKVCAKFRADLAKAQAKRAGEFKTFVFVHNDRRGMHPVVMSEMAAARTANPHIIFEHMGRKALLDEIVKLDKGSVEDLLGCRIPIEPLVYGVGMEDLAELLDHLASYRVKANPFGPLDEVSEQKLDFNAFDSDSRREIVRGLQYTYLVDEFYSRRTDVQELDEIAEGFSVFYRSVCDLWDEPEDILNDLHVYVLGNGRHRPNVQRNAWVILAYFFERCHIFEAPPDGWRPTAVDAGFPR